MKILYKSIIFLIPVLFFLIFELVLHVFDYGENLDLFIPASAPYANYKRINPSVGGRYFTGQSIVPLPSNDIFMTDKPDNGYRIFVLGGSTALGFPYGNLVMFSRILNRRLEDTFPEKRIEIVNVALTAVNSFALLDFMDEILCEDPDAILIYAGHNEYYGALGVGSRETAGHYRGLVLTFLELNNFKTFILLRSFMSWISKLSSDFIPDTTDNPYETLMERLAIERLIPEDGALYKKGEEQFEENLWSVIIKSKNAGVPVIISELVSNVRDFEPFKSGKNDSLSPADQEFSKARDYEEKKQYDLAKSAYYRAKDLDETRFRAHENMNEIIHQIANELDVPIVPMKYYFERVSPNGLIGSNLMIDHLHPNIDGYFLMADAFYKSMEKHHFVSDIWDSVYILDTDIYRLNWPITNLDSTVAEFLIRQLKGGWPFQPKFTKNRTLLDHQPKSIIEDLALKIIFDDISIDQAHYQLAQHYEKEQDYKNAKREYDVLTHLVYIEAYSYLNRAKAFYRANKFEDALIMIEECLRREKIPIAYRLAGDIYLSTGQSNKAIIQYEEALSIWPKNQEVLYSLCLAYHQRGTNQAAQNTLHRLKTLYPEDSRIVSLEKMVIMQ